MIFRICVFLSFCEALQGLKKVSISIAPQAKLAAASSEVLKLDDNVRPLSLEVLKKEFFRDDGLRSSATMVPASTEAKWVDLNWSDKSLLEEYPTTIPSNSDVEYEEGIDSTTFAVSRKQSTVFREAPDVFIEKTTTFDDDNKKMNIPPSSHMPELGHENEYIDSISDNTWRAPVSALRRAHITKSKEVLELKRNPPTLTESAGAFKIEQISPQMDGALATLKSEEKVIKSTTKAALQKKKSLFLNKSQKKTTNNRKRRLRRKRRRKLRKGLKTMKLKEHGSQLRKNIETAKPNILKPQKKALSGFIVEEDGETREIPTTAMPAKQQRTKIRRRTIAPSHLITSKSEFGDVVQLPAIVDKETNVEYSANALTSMCTDTRQIGRTLGISDIANFASGNCPLIRLYYPTVSCGQITQFVEYCNKHHLF